VLACGAGDPGFPSPSVVQWLECSSLVLLMKKINKENTIETSGEIDKRL
jgi:hypothetical protein